MFVSVELNALTYRGDQASLVARLNAITCSPVTFIFFGIEELGKHLKVDSHWLDLLSCLRSRQVWEAYLGRIVRHQIVFLVYLLSNVAAVNNGKDLAPRLCKVWVLVKVDGCHIWAQPSRCVNILTKFLCKKVVIVFRDIIVEWTAGSCVHPRHGSGFFSIHARCQIVLHSDEASAISAVRALLVHLNCQGVFARVKRPGSIIRLKFGIVAFVDTNLAQIECWVSEKRNDSRTDVA